jgi:hypothetical protein
MWRKTMFLEPSRIGTCALRKRLTDSFKLIPDAKPPKWRLTGLHWE